MHISIFLIHLYALCHCIFLLNLTLLKAIPICVFFVSSFVLVLFSLNPFICFLLHTICVCFRVCIYSTICENKINSLIAKSRYDETKRIMANIMNLRCVSALWRLYSLSISVLSFFLCYKPILRPFFFSPFAHIPVCLLIFGVL